MEGEKAAMVFTDPPYNVPIEGNVCGLGAIHHREFAMASGEMSEAEFTAFLTRALSLLARYSEDGSIHYMCMDWRHMGELLPPGAKFTPNSKTCAFGPRIMPEWDRYIAASTN